MTTQRSLLSKRSPLTPHGEFLAITAQRYRSLIARVKCDLPYTLEQFREWCLAQCGSAQGMVRCFYCAAILNIHTLECDHMTPLCQGGELELANLCPSCHSCNQQKGSMRAAAFLQLLHLVNDTSAFNHVDRTDILGRLQSSLKLAMTVQQLRRQNGSPRQERCGASAKVTITPHRRDAS